MQGRSAGELVQIASHGGGFEVDMAHFTQTELVQIAAHAAGSGARIRMSGQRFKAPSDLVQIAGNGKGAVVFAD